MEINNNIKNLRKENNFTQEELADLLGVAPQSVSKWERGENTPDISLLPILSNIFGVSIDALFGMDKINDEKAKGKIISSARNKLKENNIEAAVKIYREALKSYPTDLVYMSELSMVLALSGDKKDLKEALTLAMKVINSKESEKIKHTQRAALCFIYLKLGDKENAIKITKELPHLRESREIIEAEINKNLSESEINSCIKYISTGEE